MLGNTPKDARRISSGACCSAASRHDDLENGGGISGPAARRTIRAAATAPDSYYPLGIAEKVPSIREENTGPGGGFARIEEADIILARIREQLQARMPTSPETVALKLPEGTPVIELTRTTFDTTGAPVEVFIAVIAADMVTFDYDFPIPD